MTGKQQNFKTIFALVSLGLIALVCISAGQWQLKRAEHRDNIALLNQEASDSAPININNDNDANQKPWFNAKATGVWLHSYTIFLENRNHKGQPGYWVVTPLQLAPGYAIAVLRGWVARTISTTPKGNDPSVSPELIQKITSDTSTHIVEGKLIPRIPRALELWSWSADQSQSDIKSKLKGQNEVVPTLQNLDIKEYELATGIKLYPLVLQQSSDDHILTQEWPDPSSGADTNRGYALQWFSFSAIAIAAWLYTAISVIKKNYYKNMEPTTKNSKQHMNLAQHQSNKSRVSPLILLGIITLAPILLALLAYYLPSLGLAPSDKTNYGHLINPQRDMPDDKSLPLTDLNDQPFDLASLKGRWLLVTTDSASCPEECVRKLFILRNSHASQGKNVERLARIWFVTDDEKIDPQILEAYKGTNILRANPNQLAKFLTTETISDDEDGLQSIKKPMWIIDPLGHLMMEFPPDADPIKVRDDIRKLLKNSRIG